MVTLCESLFGDNYFSISSVDLTSSLELVGRIPPSVCWDYIDKIGKNPTKEILVLKLWPSNNDEKESYNSFFQYLSTRDR